MSKIVKWVFVVGVEGFQLQKQAQHFFFVNIKVFNKVQRIKNREDETKLVWQITFFFQNIIGPSLNLINRKFFWFEILNSDDVLMGCEHLGKVFDCFIVKIMGDRSVQNVFHFIRVWYIICQISNRVDSSLETVVVLNYLLAGLEVVFDISEVMSMACFLGVFQKICYLVQVLYVLFEHLICVLIK